jgi:hypothetical protein
MLFGLGLVGALALITAGCGGQPAVKVSQPTPASAEPSVTSLQPPGTSSQPPVTNSQPTTPASPSGPPSSHDVSDGRYVRPVVVTGLRVAPAASSSALGLDWDQARRLFASVTAISGMHDHAILGAATVTLIGTRLPKGAPTLQEQPAWVGITWGGTYNCPLEIAPPKGATTTTAPVYQPIYTAVVIYGAGGRGAIVYTGRGSQPCGGKITGPSVATAQETVSVPWTQVGAPSNGSVRLDYRAPTCATMDSTGGSGNVKTDRMTITIDLAEPFDPTGSCGPATAHQLNYQYVPAHLPPSVPKYHHPTILHGATGVVSALQVSQVQGDG